MLLRSFLSLLRTVAIVCFVNGLFLYIYLNNSQTNDSDNESIVRIPSSFSLGDFIFGNSKNEYALAETNYSRGLKIQQKQLKIIYYKTHKTASTTVGSIIFRLGAQHGAHFLSYYAHYYSFSAKPDSEVDITLNHHKSTLGFKEMMAHYKKLVPTGKFLSVLREPTRRYLSAYHYYFQPGDNRPLSAFMADKTNNNALVRDFGIHTEANLSLFMETTYDQFTFLITENLDESLLLLKRAWGWTLQDILYIKLNDACKKGVNYAGRRMSCRPQYGNLTTEELQMMRKNNQLDIILYERALNDTNAALAQQPQSFWNELAVFKAMKQDLQAICTARKNYTIPKTCEPYFWDDVKYEAKIRDGKGWVYNYPVFSAHFG